jgi:hypothetical protein
MADRSFFEKLPRHAAAVFLAVGLMNCNSKSGLKSNLGDGSAADGTQAADTKPIADTATFKDQGGMMEAPPPPMDAPAEVSVDVRPDVQADVRPDVQSDVLADAGADIRGDASADVRGDTADSRANDAGRDTAVSEAGAVDLGTLVDTKAILDTAVFKDQGGMIEAPPPPMDAPIVKKD